jgi:hypothetical protein
MVDKKNNQQKELNNQRKRSSKVSILSFAKITAPIMVNKTFKGGM